MLVPAARLMLRVLPETPAYRLTTFLAALPRRMPVDRSRAGLRTAGRLRWGPGRRHVALAWGSGPPIVMVHGWGGRAAQMAPLGQHLARLGFRTLAPDITGHGESPGSRISFRQFVEDIGVFVRELGEPIHALVGHSAGGLTMMAARPKFGVQAEHYVCLNAPRAPYPPLATLRRLLAPNATVLARCREHFFAQFDMDSGQLDRGGAFRYFGQGRLLLVYDLGDDQVGHDDAELIAQGWPEPVVLKTEGLGHHRALWTESVHAAIGAFLIDSPNQDRRLSDPVAAR